LTKMHVCNNGIISLILSPNLTTLKSLDYKVVMTFSLNNNNNNNNPANIKKL